MFRDAAAGRRQCGFAKTVLRSRLVTAGKRDDGMNCRPMFLCPVDASAQGQL